MKVTLRIAEGDLSELRRHVLADMPREAGAFALAGAARAGGDLSILVRRPLAIPREQFGLQHEYRLEVAAQAVNGLVALCEANELGAVICHSHPEDIPYSASDDFGEERIAQVMRQFIPAGAPVASLLFWPCGIRGRVWLPDRTRPVTISEIVAIGPHVSRIRPDVVHDGVGVERIYDRQVLAFGREGQAALALMRVGIVGVGGTGSAVVEQLARLGVIDFVLVDPDVLEDSNVTRVYGTFSRRWPLSRMRRRKVSLISRHIRRISPHARIRTLPDHVANSRAAQALLDRDMIFLCTDDHWGRSVVNQLSYQYLIPVINLGVRIDTIGPRITAAVGVVDVLRPGLACLWCKQILRADRIAAESMPFAERKTREREGYVEGLDVPAPSVISLTTTLAGLGVTLFLQMATGFMGDSGDVSRLNLDALTGTVRRGVVDVESSCVCRKVRGYGDLRPLPTQHDLSFLRR